MSQSSRPARPTTEAAIGTPSAGEGGGVQTPADGALHLPHLPELCSPGVPSPSGLPACFTKEQKAIDFVLQPPQSTFVFNASLSKIFAWCVSTHPDTNLTIDSAMQYSNLGIGLGRVVGNLDLALLVGADGSISGLDDREVTVG